MSNTNKHIRYQDLLLQKIFSQFKQVFRFLSQVPRLFVHFCLIHWKEISVIFYGSLLMGLWLFVAYNKFSDFDKNMEGMLRQPFPKPFATFLAYAIPGSELLAGVLIGYNRTRLFGLGFSSLLMIAFTSYVGFAILHVWSDTLPCNCGLILQIGWKKHFIFNLFLLLISSWAFVLQWWILKSKLLINSGNKINSNKITQSVPKIWNGKNAIN